MLIFHLQRGLEAEHSLSWTPLSLGLYHDLKANLVIFRYLYLPITQRKPILFRKEDCFIRLHRSSKGQTRTGELV